MSLSKILPLIIIFATFPAFSESNDFCTKNIEVTTEGTASSWENLRNNKGSLRYETESILKSGLSTLGEKKYLKISSTPKEFLKDYEDAKYCESKFALTKSSPFTYTPKSFSSVEDLNNWIGKFSQGSGAEGSDLYAKCDRSCSPQYEYVIEKVGGTNLNIKANVLCGPARNKDDNMYIIKARCS